MRLLLIIILILAAFFLLLLYGIYRGVFYNSDRRKGTPGRIPDTDQYQEGRHWMHSLIRSMEQIPWEEITICSEDGLKLFGRYYHIKDGAPLQIQFHGYRGTAFRDFCGGNKIAREHGMNSLVVDERAHGKSGGHTITFGIRERYDVRSWAKYAMERFGKDTPVILAGISMGAASVLMASGLELPENVAGIIADCPFSSPRDIICEVIRRRKMPERIVWRMVRLSALLYARIDLLKESAAEAVRRAKVPILLIHGEEDRFVPCVMSKILFGKCAPKACLETFPDAGHGVSYVADVPRYEKAVLDFCAEVTGGNIER